MSNDLTEQARFLCVHRAGRCRILDLAGIWDWRHKRRLERANRQKKCRLLVAERFQNLGSSPLSLPCQCHPHRIFPCEYIDLLPCPPQTPPPLHYHYHSTIAHFSTFTQKSLLPRTKLQRTVQESHSVQDTRYAIGSSHCPPVTSNVTLPARDPQLASCLCSDRRSWRPSKGLAGSRAMEISDGFPCPSAPGLGLAQGPVASVCPLLPRAYVCYP
jgi:hypothetical protein